MAQVLWIVLSVILLIMAAVLTRMAIEPFFPTGERVFLTGMGICLCAGVFFMLTRLGELTPIAAGLAVVAAPVIGCLEPGIEKLLRSRDPGMKPRRARRPH